MSGYEVVSLEEYFKSLPESEFIFPEESNFVLKHSFEKHSLSSIGGVNSLEITNFLFDILLKEAAKENINILYIAPTHKIDNSEKEDTELGNFFWMSNDGENTTYDFLYYELLQAIAENNISLLIIDSLNDFISEFFKKKLSRYEKIATTFRLLKSLQRLYPVSILITHTTKQEKSKTPSSDGIKEDLVYCMSQIVLLISNLDGNKRSITNIRNKAHKYSPTMYYTTN